MNNRISEESYNSHYPNDKCFWRDHKDAMFRAGTVVSFEGKDLFKISHGNSTCKVARSDIR